MEIRDFQNQSWASPRRHWRVHFRALGCKSVEVLVRGFTVVVVAIGSQMNTLGRLRSHVAKKLQQPHLKQLLRWTCVGISTSAAAFAVGLLEGLRKFGSMRVIDPEPHDCSCVSGLSAAVAALAALEGSAIANLSKGSQRLRGQHADVAI